MTATFIITKILLIFTLGTGSCYFMHEIKDKSLGNTGWGAWTSLFNPFWYIPLLAINRMKARHLFGYCIAIILLAIIPCALELTFIPY